MCPTGGDDEDSDLDEDEDEDDVGDVRLGPPTGEADLAHRVHRGAPAQWRGRMGQQSLRDEPKERAAWSMGRAHRPTGSLALDLDSEDGEEQDLDGGAGRVPGQQTFEISALQRVEKRRNESHQNGPETPKVKATFED